MATTAVEVEETNQNLSPNRNLNLNLNRLCVRKIHRYLNVDQSLHHRPVKTAIHHILAGVYNPLHQIWIAGIFPRATSKLWEVIPIGLMVIMMALVVKAVVLA